MLFVKQLHDIKAWFVDEKFTKFKKNCSRKIKKKKKKKKMILKKRHD